MSAVKQVHSQHVANNGCSVCKGSSNLLESPRFIDPPVKTVRVNRQHSVRTWSNRQGSLKDHLQYIYHLLHNAAATGPAATCGVFQSNNGSISTVDDWMFRQGHSALCFSLSKRCGIWGSDHKRFLKHQRKSCLNHIMKVKPLWLRWSAFWVSSWRVILWHWSNNRVCFVWLCSQCGEYWLQRQAERLLDVGRLWLVGAVLVLCLFSCYFFYVPALTKTMW